MSFDEQNYECKGEETAVSAPLHHFTNLGIGLQRLIRLMPIPVFETIAGGQQRF